MASGSTDGSKGGGSLGVTSHHELQVEGYLRFARTKRNQHLKEMDLILRDCVNLRLEETVYTKANVTDLMQDLGAELRGGLEKELEYAAYATGLLLRGLFEQAEEVGYEMWADLNKLENMNLLADMKACELASIHKPAALYTVKSQARKLARIEGGGTDPKIIMERDALKKELAETKERCRDLERQNSSAQSQGTKLRSSLGETMSDFEKTAEELRSKEAEVSKLEANLRELKEKVERLEKEKSALETRGADSQQKVEEVSASLAQTQEQQVESLKALKEELATTKLELSDMSKQVQARLNESRQFVTMKKLMQTKTTQLQELRKRLSKYEEPDTIPCADEEAA